MRLNRMLQMVETKEVQERRGVNKEIWELQRELEERKDCVLDVSGEECVVQGRISGIPF